jgi:hypothetical protein
LDPGCAKSAHAGPGHPQGHATGFAGSAVTVQQATLSQLEKPLSMRIARPAEALPGRGGVGVSLRHKLADGSGGFKTIRPASAARGLGVDGLERHRIAGPSRVAGGVARACKASGRFRTISDVPIWSPPERRPDGVHRIGDQPGRVVPPQDVLQRALKGLEMSSNPA